MSSLNGRKLVAATMHTNIFYPGMGEIRKELSAVGSGLSRGVKMTIDEPFIVVEAVGKDGQSYTIPVPITNFSHLVLGKKEE